MLRCDLHLPALEIEVGQTSEAETCNMRSPELASPSQTAVSHQVILCPAASSLLVSGATSEVSIRIETDAAKLSKQNILRTGAATEFQYATWKSFRRCFYLFFSLFYFSHQVQQD